MLIAVTSMQKSINAPVSKRFGWSEYIFVAETETRVVRIIDNRSNASRALGAGAKAAELLARLGVKWVATGQIGAESFNILKNSGIHVVTCATGTCREILDRLAEGGLLPAEAPTDPKGCFISSTD
jgi:predicted Fe-Mo cluster-binding NifX family protein